MTILAKIQEHGDHIYMTSPVGLWTPDEAEIETLAFSADLKRMAPNPKIMWLQGQYVEADNANRNGDQWTADDLAIKHLTPMLMPISVMHDFRSSVGVIADTKLLTPDADQVPRASIRTTLAVWAHRFPEIAHEIQQNAEAATLMQSMECVSSAYDCSVCGQTFSRLPGGKEREMWCAHLRGEALGEENVSAARILRNVCFTGTGLIFGTRGARGAYPDAHLEVEELAAFHREAHEATSPKSKRRKGVMEIEDTKFQELVAQAAAGEKLPAETKRADEAEAKVETAEAEKVKADEAVAAEKKRADEAEEKVNVATLRDERLEKLGPGFLAKLDKLETTAKRVREQAGTLSPEDWTARLDELEETLSVKRDAKAEETAGDDDADKGKTEEEKAAERERLASEKDLLLDSDEVTASHVGGGGDTQPASREPHPDARRSVIGGLVKRNKPAQETAGAKS